MFCLWKERIKNRKWLEKENQHISTSCWLKVHGQLFAIHVNLFNTTIFDSSTHILMVLSYKWPHHLLGPQMWYNSISRDVSENELQPVLISDLQLLEITRELFPHVLNKKHHNLSPSTLRCFSLAFSSEERERERRERREREREERGRERERGERERKRGERERGERREEERERESVHWVGVRDTESILSDRVI